jgi:hypothetical protein
MMKRLDLLFGRLALAVMLTAAGVHSHAFVATIAAGTRTLYLQVGAGSVTGGSFNSGGTPGNNSTINSVSVNVPSAALGTGVQAMTTDSTVTVSPLDNFTFCAVPAQVYVGGFYRTPGAGGNGTLSVTSPPTLSNGLGDTLPFTSISWVSGGAGDAVATIPSGTFTGATQTLYSVTRNNWFESCLAFNYANTALVPAGTFTGRVTYTLAAP